MASSNRHWPSMFKSKPCNPHHQWQHDINSSLISSACHRTPFSSGGGCEERSPEPKPRWNPKPEQIRILEAIFNSGMVNPPRDEIRKIRAQLQEFGQVGDANVFYWFQNRKSRSKHKLRHLQNSKNNNNNHHNPEVTQQNHALISLSPQKITAPSNSSSSSSDKSSPKETPPSTKVFSIGFSDVGPNSPTASVNQSFFHNETATLLPPPPPQPSVPAEAFFFPVVPNSTTVTSSSQGFCFSELSNVVQHNNNVGPCTSLLLSEIMNHGAAAGSKKADEHDKSFKMLHQTPLLNFCFTPSTAPSINIVPPVTTTTSVTVPSPLIAHLQGIGDPPAAPRPTVFINDVAFEVAAGPFNVREAFGDDAVLIHATGQPVLTNQWGVTLQPLQHGACYYLI